MHRHPLKAFTYPIPIPVLQVCWYLDFGIALLEHALASSTEGGYFLRFSSMRSVVELTN